MRARELLRQYDRQLRFIERHARKHTGDADGWVAQWMLNRVRTMRERIADALDTMDFSEGAVEQARKNLSEPNGRDATNGGGVHVS